MDSLPDSLRNCVPGYAELHCLTSFSFLRGASHAHELVARASELDYAALAITDECSLAGVVRAHEAAKELKLPLIIGSELRLEDGIKLVVLAMNLAGYGNLSAIITLARGRSEKGSYRLTRGDLARGIPDCLALWIAPADAMDDDARWLARGFPQRCWIAYENHMQPGDEERLGALQMLSCRSGIPLVASGDVHMHVRTRRPLQDVLTALRLKTSVDLAGYALYSNGERHLRSRSRLAMLYPAELLTETLRIAAMCEFSLDEIKYEYPDEVVPENETPASYLRAEVDNGLDRRYPGGVPAKVRQQAEDELELIADKGYETYFLTVYDIVSFARSKHILCQGRGSAANSVVCYALRITEVNPDESNLLFGRFLSRERDEPPDIDVDFEHQRREEVIQYIFAKYGHDRAALAATVISYRTRSALRDVGRALGIDIDRINALTSSLAWWDKPDQWNERFAAVGLDLNSPRVQNWLFLARQLKGFPRHLSQHVGGFVICRGRLDRLVPIENAAMKDRRVIQWDKDDLESLKLLKVDVLALGMLSAIRRMLDMLSRREGRPCRMNDIPHKDAATYDMICKADTIGVFQIESRAQMSMLPRLKPREFYDLVVQVAIVRPGPIQGDMVHPYLRRREKKEEVTYPTEAVKDVLKRTLGVPIFQEQVMQLSMVAAGFSSGEADQLRRAMAAWKKKGGLEPFEKKLVEGMTARGYPLEFAQRLFEQVKGFGDYGFPESHAASFAILAYFSAWLKCHHPDIFLCGLLNSQPMGFYSSSQLVQDAQRHGVEVRPPDVTASDWGTVPEPGGAQGRVRLGLHQVQALGEAVGKRIEAARRHAPFVDVNDLARRAQLTRRDLDALAKAGVLARLAGHRREAAWVVAAVPMQRDLLLEAPIVEAPPLLPKPSEGDDIVADYASLHLTLGRHPLALLRRRLYRHSYVPADQLKRIDTGVFLRCVGIVTGRQRPGTATGVIFVTLEDETGYTNVIVHAGLAERQRRELLGAHLLGVYGVLQREGDVVHLIARRLVDHSALLGRLSTRSRDFH